MTGVLVAPILGPYGRNQLSIAVNATHQHGDPHSPPETRSDCPLQTTSKLRITCGPPLMWGLNQWIGGVARRLSCSATMRRGGLRRISQSCRSCYGNPERSLLAACAVYAPLTKTAAPLTPQKNAPWGTYRELQPERGRNGMRRLKGNPTAEYKEAQRTRLGTGGSNPPSCTPSTHTFTSSNRQIECRVKPSDVAFS